MSRKGRRPISSRIARIGYSSMNQGAHPHTGRRIGVVTYDFDPPIGGLGVLVRTYVDELRKLFPGDTYIVISPSANVDESGSRLGRARFRKAGGCPLFSLALCFTLSRIIRKHKLDLIHVHSGSGGVFLLRRPPCKLVVTAHHTYRQEAELVFARAPIKRIWKRFMAMLESRTYHLADTVICVSRDTADEIITRYGVPASRVCVIENPVRVGVSGSLQNLPKNPDTILFVGRLEERKGIRLLLKAFEILKSEMPTVRLRLIGRNLMGHHLTSIIQSSGLSDSIEMLGYVQDSLRFREMAQATVLVVPSLLEGFGLVAAEAMMLGTCVVASDAPGLRSIISNGKTGVLFPASSSRACAEALKRVLSDSQLRSRLEQEALLQAPNRFGIEHRTSDVRDVYVRVLQ